MAVYVGESTLIFTGGTIATGGASSGDLAAEIADRQAGDDELAANIGKIFRSRIQAENAGQAGLPATYQNIITMESGVLTVRQADAQADDPLFATHPYWGVITRIDMAAEIAARQAGDAALAQNVGKIFQSRQAAVNVGHEGLPFSYRMIATLESNPLPEFVIRIAGSSDDALFPGEDRPWGVSMRIPFIGRNVVSTKITNFSSLNFERGTTAVWVTATNDPQLWKTIDPPAVPDPAIHQQDSNGNWYELVWSSAGIQQGLDQEIAARAGLQNLLTDPVTVREGSPADLANDTPSGSASTSTLNLLPDVVFDVGGTVTRMEANANASGNVRLRTYTRDGNNFTMFAEVDVPVVAGYNNITGLSLEVPAGGYVGWSSGAFINVMSSNTYEVWRGGNLANPNFTQASLNNNSHMIAAHVDTVQAKGSVTPEADTTVDQDQTVTASRVSFAGFDSTVEIDIAPSTGLPGTTTQNTISGGFTHPAAAAGLLRYDYIVLDRLTGQLARVAGTARAGDPEEYQASLESYQTPVARVRVSDTAITSISPIALETTLPVPASVSSNVEKQIAAIRKGCPSFFAKVRNREPVRIVAIGDSITAVRGDGPPVEGSVNGPLRDAGVEGGFGGNAYFNRSARYGSDTIAAVPQYTAVQLGRADDGAGAIHTRIGMVWGIVEALERMGYILGTDLFYDNMATPGENSSTVWDLGTNSPTALLDTAVALNPDLAVITHGMNERGSADTEPRLTAIGQYLRGLGIDVVYSTLTRPNGSGNQASWRRTNSKIRRVAAYVGTGVIPLDAIGDDPLIGALGVASEDLAAIDGLHPGLIEFRQYAKLGAMIIEGL